MSVSLELLAPAGTAEIGMAAIEHGADAVYVGAPKFSARAEAGVTLSEMERLIRYAHLYYGRVYVALNTILTDREIPEALDIIRSVHQLGADGLIIQDVGLLELDLPPIALIASTQMHNLTVEKVRFLEAVGFNRVILARELSIREIARIRRETRVELEAFVHGALCVAYSGQCFMGQLVARRSGNRGVCVQPCRFRYSLFDGDGRRMIKDKFLLSLKDLNRINAIEDLVNAGITSFKIEGRYKDIAYVKNITAAYRMAIDAFIAVHPQYQRASSGTSIFLFTPNPERTFHRGYTDYFLYDTQEKIAGIDTQKAIGSYVGTVTAIGKTSFQMKGGKLQNGDGLCFFTGERHLSGFRVDKVNDDDIHPNTMKGLSVGTVLYRNRDHVFSGLLHGLSAKRTIEIDLVFTQMDKGIELAVIDTDGNREVQFASIPFEPAHDSDRMRKQIEKQLRRTGNTPFQVSTIQIFPDQPGFVQLASLNALRRDALDLLTALRLQNHTNPAPAHRFLFSNPYPETVLDYRANVLNGCARRFYERHGAKVVEPAFEALIDPTGKTIMTTRYCIRRELGYCLRFPESRERLKDPLTMSDGRHVYRLEFDCNICRMSVIFERRR